MDKQTFKQLIVEGFGTFVLTLIVLISLNTTLPLPTPVLAAITLGVFAATIGAISNCHINPAVTIAMAVVKEITPSKAGMYIIAQLIGAFLARAVITFIKINPTLATPTESLSIGLFEMLGTLVFVFGISAVVSKKAPEAIGPFVIGLSLLLGIMVASFQSLGILNPAVALGIGALSPTYLLAPIFGALAATLFYSWVQK